jgi:hypothetical protein
MSDPESTPSQAEARARSRRRKLMRERRQDRAARKERIFDKLVQGVPHAAIARYEKCSIHTVRQTIARELASRRIEPAGDFAKLQIARLNDALMVVHDKMLEGDMAGVDRLLKVVAELDRYHGFAQALDGKLGGAVAALAAPPRAAPLALPAPEPIADEG